MNEEPTVESGDPIFDEDGTELGVVTGATTDGLTVSVNEEIEYVGSGTETGSDELDAGTTSEDIDPDEHDPGPEFGEGYIMWRCDECGEMGELEDGGLPENCPSCGSGRVNKWKED